MPQYILSVAFSAIIVSIISACVSIASAFLTRRNNIVLQTRKLKEDHYVSYIVALHNLGTEDGNQELMSRYAFERDRLILIASEDVIQKMLLFEEKVMGKVNVSPSMYLTPLIKAIRSDLKLKSKNLPEIEFKK